MVAPNLQDGEPMSLTRTVCPGAQQRVLPLPAGAEMIVTFPSVARSSAARRSPRSISRGLPDPPSETRRVPGSDVLPSATHPSVSVLLCCQRRGSPKI